MNYNQLWGDLIIEELVRHNTKCFCISPGSRSTPLTLAAANNQQANSLVFYDERAASYFALGHARGTGQPAVLICTSGTAAANYLPAITESSVEQIPMLVLTADRPPELHDTGANQSINQTNLFGSHIRWFFDPGCPSKEFRLEALLTAVDHAISKTLHPLPGPVHINLQFREPLTAKNQIRKNKEINQLTSKKTYVQYSKPKNILQSKEIKELIKICPESGILSIGRVPRKSLTHIREFAKELSWPVFADITSGLRLGNNCPFRVTYYDQLLLEKLESEKMGIDAIWHIGFPPISKRWLEFWEKKPSSQMVWIADHSERHDQSHNFRWKIETDIVDFCSHALSELKLKKRKNKFNQKTLNWLKANKRIENLLEQHFISDTDKIGIDEFSLAHKLSEVIHKTHGFFIGNSIPARAVDSFGSSRGPDIPTALNRGASGIDGLIASACGYSSGINKAVTLLIGDISALHDLNSFKLLSNSDDPIFVVLINNQGGGIFSLLPIIHKTENFEGFFGTPHNHDFRLAAEMFKLNYFSPRSITDFELDYKKALKENKSTVIEIFSERKNIAQNLNIIRKKIVGNII